MSKISLRTYNREIDSLIDQERIDEAVEHCKHILQIFPKYLDTYRILGKAYLENRQYNEAMDILRRVLNVVPDDLLAHIGMSIIHEDNNNLDAAIWHMERAYEAQPSNVAIQDELKRLNRRRDGMTPSKIFLTRAALVRLYARGELFSQAIAEAQAALLEDINRVDIEVLLARVLFLSGNKSDAIEVSFRILSKLPFCYEANKILTDLLPGEMNSDILLKCKEKIIAIDPYSAYISQNASTSAQVPENAITIDKLEWPFSQMVDPTFESEQNILNLIINKEDSILRDYLINDETRINPEEGISPRLQKINLFKADSLQEQTPDNVVALSWFESLIPSNQADQPSPFIELKDSDQIRQSSINENIIEGIEEVPAPDLMGLGNQNKNTALMDQGTNPSTQTLACDPPITNQGVEESEPYSAGMVNPSLVSSNSGSSLENAIHLENNQLKLEENTSEKEIDNNQQNEIYKGQNLPKWLDGVLLETNSDNNFISMSEIPVIKNISEGIMPEKEDQSSTQQVLEKISNLFKQKPHPTPEKENGNTSNSLINRINSFQNDKNNIDEVSRVNLNQEQSQSINDLNTNVECQSEIITLDKNDIEVDSSARKNENCEINSNKLDFQEIYDQATDLIKRREFPLAIEKYHILIEANQSLQNIIRDIKNALISDPGNSNLWVILGDAYLKDSNLEEAQIAYSKADDLLH